MHIGLLILIAVLPFGYWPWAIDPNLGIQCLLVAAFLLFYAVSLLRRGKETGVEWSSGAAWLWLTFLAISAVPGAWAHNKSEFLNAWSILFLAGGVFHASSRLFREPSLLSRAAATVAASALVLGLLAVFQFVDKGIREPSGRILYEVTATLGHKNLLSSFLLLTLPFSLYAGIAERGWRRMLGCQSAALSLSLILLLQTRSVWMGLGAACLLGLALLVLFPGRFRKDPEGIPANPTLRRAAPWIAALVLFLGAFTFAARGGGLEALAQRAGSAFSTEENDWRLRLWRKTLAMVGDHPMGVGLGNWKIHLPEYGMDELGIDWGNGERERFGLQLTRPHNDWLWILSETGPAGLLTFAAFFVAVLYGAVGNIRASTQLGDRLFSLLAAAGIVGYMAESTFSFPMERPSHLAYMMILAGAVSGMRSRRRPEWVPAASVNRAAQIATLTLAGLALYVGAARLLAEMWTARLLEARAVEDWPRVIDLANRAESWFYPLDPTNNTVSFYRGTAYYLLGDIRRGCSDFAEAHRLFPQHLHVLNNLGTCNTMEGKTEAAFEYYRRALRIASRFDGALLNMVALHQSMGNYDQAWEVLISIDNDHHNPEVSRFFDVLEPLLNRSRP